MKVFSMAVALEFINLIVPIALIRQKYPGGWEQCLTDHDELIGGKVWYDEHLFRDGAMNPMDMKNLVLWWENKGFNPFVEQDKNKHFKDLCIVEGMLGGKTLPCGWLSIADDRYSAFLTGTEQGVTVYRMSSEERERTKRRYLLNGNNKNNSS